MDDKEKLILDDSLEAPRKANVKQAPRNAKLPWYFAGGFLMFWGLLFFAVVLPYFYRLPTAMTVEDVGKNVFIAERAYNNLYTLSNIGMKLSGTDKNEVEALNFLLSELAKIKENMNTDLFDMEIDHSKSSGLFVIKTFHRVYQGVQNIAVKLSPKNIDSDSYLLINSHFDSESGPGAGDAGFMIVTMMEVLRVISSSKQPIQNPIVFLFNGAEEGGLQATHGFITTHRWAPFCKAVINLDAAGTGGRDILFQTGPDHPWLAKYYKDNIKHPFATTMAEEIFQAGLIPSDTDFRQFKTYAKIPGLDMAQCINGFVYHTRYDTIDVIPRESLQNTGNNLLGLVRGLANATELHDTEAHKTGHAVFFDFLGIYFFHYSEATGKMLNFEVSGAALILIIISMWRMATVSKESLYLVVNWFILVTVVQIIAFALALVLPIVVANTMDSYGHSLTYFSTPVLIIGLYVCPSLIGLGLPLAIYYSVQCNNKLSVPYHLQLALHGQAVILAVLSIVVTYMGYRSAYIFTIPLIFYVIALGLNLMTILHDLGYAWTGLLKLSQVVPFLYSSYLFYTFVVVLRPMAGRSGAGTNQDLYIAVMSGLGTVLSFGFLVPLINTFRRPSLVIITLIATTALTVFLATNTQLGFPYRPKTNVQRISYLDVRNIYYDYDGTVSKDESGYLMLFNDRRQEKPLLGTKANLTGMISLKSACEKHMMCGMPLYDNRFVTQRLYTSWIPRSEPLVPPLPTTLELLNKTVVNATTVRFEFSLKGPTIMRLFIKALEDVTISDWSFLSTYLENPPPAPVPHQIYMKYFTDDTPFKFFFEFYKSNGDFKVPMLELGVSAHYTAYEFDAASKEFAATFPSFAFLDHWPAFYQRYYF